MKLAVLLIAAINADTLECYAEQDKFDLGHSSLAVRPTCNSNNSRLYNEVQCSGTMCACTDTVTGQPSVPARSIKVESKAMLKCSGTNCLAQQRTAQQLAASGLMDVSGPECDIMGNYKIVQCNWNHCFCQDRTGQFSKWAGANGVDNTFAIELEFQLKHCLTVLNQNGWTINGPK